MIKVFRRKDAFFVFLLFQVSFAQDSSLFSSIFPWFQTLQRLNFLQDTCGSSCELPPTIMISNFDSNTDWTKDWAVGQSHDNEISIVANSTSGKIKLALSCNASYEVYWEFIGYQSNRNESQSHEQAKQEFLISLNSSSKQFTTVFMEFNLTSKDRKIITVSCEHIINDLATKVNIFLPGEKALIHSGQTIEYKKNESWVKCPTSNPNVNVVLFAANPAKNGLFEEFTAHLPYNPSIGFKLRQVLKGKYQCRAGKDDIVTFEPKDKTEDAELLLAYQYTILHKEISSKCNDSDSDVALLSTTYFDTSDQNRNRRDFETRRGVQRWITLKNKNTTNSYYEIDVIGNDIVVELHCVKDDEPNLYGRVTSHWQIVPLPIPTQHLFYDIVDPTSESFYRPTDKVNSTLGRFEWRETQIQEVLIEADKVVYLNDTSSFNCSTSSPDLIITFWLGYDNGTFVRINSETFKNSTNETINQNIVCRRKLRLYNLQVPEEASSFSCRVNVKSHPTLYLSDNVYFATEYTQMPSIQNETALNPECIQENALSLSTCEFNVEEANKVLTCPITGNPLPEFEWRKDGQSFNLDAVKFGYSETKNQLHFPPINDFHNGNYTCTATNRAGSESYFFIVKVEGNVVQRIVKIIVLVGASCVLLGLSILGIGMFRVRKAKKLMRGITEEEIQEFFKGRGKVAEQKNSNPNKVSGNYDMMPYQNQYETDMQDTKLDYKTILGKGEFALVVKGYIHSKQLDVAVKIAKTTADVELFKGMLSEIKILTHIGTHKHLVGLVGANTEDIRNHNLYIYMDLCELGSLEKYLRKNKDTFINLIDQNQKIVPELLPADTNYSEVSFSTLDLIRWAAEIATAMEYLAYKSVIHMDLAARNVLLTREKTAKVSDFGLSRQLKGSNLYQKTTKSPLPWRWMALESLKAMEFSTETDVWSYGVTLWEIFSLGDLPFPHESWTVAFMEQLASGMRLGNPEYCTPEFYVRIVGCWEISPSKRPNFGFLRGYFEGVYKTFTAGFEDETPDYDVLEELPPPPQELVDPIFKPLQPTTFNSRENVHFRKSLVRHVKVHQSDPSARLFL